MTDYPTELSYECIDTKPLDYEFSGEKWAEMTEDGSGWRVCEGSIVPDDLETEIQDGKYALELDTDDYEITVTSPTDDDYCESYTPSDDEWNNLIEKFGIDCDDLHAQINGDDNHRWEPMMNYAYPLGSAPPSDWKALVTTCTCVEIDGDYYLALTGGGMDLSWEICETFMRLGYWPPAHFSRLPAMSGRGTSERDKWIIMGCRTSLEGMRDRAERGIRDLDSLTESD